MIIKYNFVDVDVQSFELLTIIKRGSLTPYSEFRGLFKMEAVSHEGDEWIAYRKKDKTLLLDTIETEEVVMREISKQAMILLLNKIVGITTDVESIKHAFTLAEELGIEVSKFNFEAHKEDTLAIYFDSLNEIYYAQ